MATKDFNHDNKITGFDHYVEHQISSKGTPGCCIMLTLPIVIVAVVTKRIINL